VRERVAWESAAVRESGSVSVVILGVLIVLAILFLSGSLLVELSLRSIRRGRDRDRAQQILADTAREAVEMLVADDTPFADSRNDAVWAGIEALSAGGPEVELQDLSSRLGLNWIRKEPLERLRVLKPGKSAQELQQFREDTGIHLNLVPAFSDFVEEEQIEELFTAYSPFNVNICDEFVLRKLHLVRSGDPQAAEWFHGKVQEARIAGRQIEPGGLREFLGEQDYRLLYPVLTAEPVMNIHFAPDKIVRELFEHYEVPSANLDLVLEERESSEWTGDDLKALVGEKYQETVLHHYFGVRTWFWRIDVSDGKLELVWILARLPQEDQEAGASFQLIEESIRP
jgi:hypothetical protein